METIPILQSQPQVQPAQPEVQPVIQASQVSLYNPKRYALIGFLFSLVPVFIMSISNARKLKNGEFIRSTVIKFAVIYAAAVGIFYGLVIWCSNAFVKALATDGSLNSFQTLIYQNGNEFFVGVNILLLVFLVRSLNKSELPEYREMEKVNMVKVRSAVLPVIAGLVFSGLVFIGVVAVNGYYMTTNLRNTVTNQFLNSVQSQGSLSQVSTSNSPIQPSPSDSSNSAATPCDILTIEEISKITGFSIAKVVKESTGCSFVNAENHSVGAITTYEADFTQVKEALAANPLVELVFYDQLQSGSFLAKRGISDDFYFVLDGKSYGVYVSHEFGPVAEDAAVRLAAAIMKVPFQASASENSGVSKRPSLPGIPKAE